MKARNAMALVITSALMLMAAVPAAALAAPPANTNLPVITPSNPIVYGTATTTRGTWTNSPTSYKYQWEKCTGSCTSWVTIAGATGTTYTVATTDNGYRLRTKVTATNADGSASATSAQTSAVQYASDKWTPPGTHESGTWPGFKLTMPTPGIIASFECAPKVRLTVPSPPLSPMTATAAPGDIPTTYCGSGGFLEASGTWQFRLSALGGKVVSVNIPNKGLALTVRKEAWPGSPMYCRITSDGPIAFIGKWDTTTRRLSFSASIHFITDPTSPFPAYCSLEPDPTVTFSTLGTGLYMPTLQVVSF